MAVGKMSEFAECLRALLDDTGIFTRKEWGEYFFGRLMPGDGLNKHERRIESWLTDVEIPRATDLSMLRILVDEDSIFDYSQDERVIAARNKFDKMAEKRATLVSPHGSLMLPTVNEYFSRLLFCDVSNKLAKLNREEKIKLLEELYPE
jgi:hypothetical protein